MGKDAYIRALRICWLDQTGKVAAVGIPAGYGDMVNMRRSLDTLQGRGLISEERGMSNTDPFYDSAFSARLLSSSYSL